MPIQVYYKGMISVFDRLRIYLWCWRQSHSAINQENYFPIESKQ